MRSPNTTSRRGPYSCAGDLDDERSLEGALGGVDRVYVHALSADAASADPAELARAGRLARAAARAGGLLGRREQGVLEGRAGFPPISHNPRNVHNPRPKGRAGLKTTGEVSGI